MSELECVRAIDTISRQNRDGVTPLAFVGAGAYNHFIPAAVDYLASRGEFTTSYTPYQAEASQGTVQAIFEYQSMMAELLSMEVVNASHYDGATAVAEAVLMAVRATGDRGKAVLSGSIHPEYLAVVDTYCGPQGIEVCNVDPPELPDADGPSVARLLENVDHETACLVVQSPDFLGRLSDYQELAAEVHGRGALLVIHIDPIAAGLFTSPGKLGADIVTGEGQPLGIPLGYGGPYLGILATRRSLVRKMPGRLAGETKDSAGRRGYVLTLNTREQHIRREKATSNICTNQGLMALRAAIYLALMGPVGLREVATLCYQNAHYTADRLKAIPECSVNNDSGEPFFKEFVLRVPIPATDLVDRLREKAIIPGLPLEPYFPQRRHELLVAVTETSCRDDIDVLVDAIAAECRA
jgi:glycine dehydrogenase subunit 1